MWPAQSFGEGIGHTAADDQSIYFVQKTLDNRDLAGNLSAAQDGNEGSLRILYGIAEEIDLFLHQITYYAGIYELGNANVGAVCSVSSTECIVYKYITKGSQLFGEVVLVLGLLCAITGVLQKDDITVFHLSYSSFCVRSYNFRISSEFYFLTKKLGETCSYRSQRQLGFRLSLGFSKMGAKDYFSAVSDQFFDGRQSSYQTVLVCDLSDPEGER